MTRPTPWVVMTSLCLTACHPCDRAVEITDPDSLVSEDALAWVRDKLEVFTDWTGPDRVCIDEVRVIPGLADEEDMDFAFGRYARRGRRSHVELTEQVFVHFGELGFHSETVLWHELCHALDDREGISAAHADLFDPEALDHLTQGYHVPEGGPEVEVFALACDGGPPDVFAAYADASCGEGLDPWQRVLNTEVFPARSDGPNPAGPAPQIEISWWPEAPSPMRLWGDVVPVEGRVAALVRPEAGAPPEIWFYDQDGVEVVSLPEAWDEAWKIWPDVDGGLWVVRDGAMASVGPDGALGEDLALHGELVRTEHALVLDPDTVLAYGSDLLEGSESSGVFERDSGALVQALPFIYSDQDGYTVLDGEVWVPSYLGGPFRLMDEGWVQTPSPSGRYGLFRHQGQLMSYWDAYVEGGSLGGLTTVEADGGWTPLGDACAPSALPMVLTDLGEALAVRDPNVNRMGAVSLSW